jgi:plastocyanin
MSLLITLLVGISYMNRNLRLGSIAALLLALVTTLAYEKVYPQSASQKVFTVSIASGSGSKAGAVSIPFSPNTLFIHKGDIVSWSNRDTVNHTVVALSFNSGIIWPQGSAHGSPTYSHTFDKEGTFIYVDKLHPYMGGVIYVDVPTSQRELVSTTGSFVKVNVEMPQNAAYENNYGPFFIPANTQVTSGTMVTWTNKDYVAHTATSGDGFSFDTKTILPSQSISLTIKNKGTFPYFCKIHPWMIGSVTVS